MSSQTTQAYYENRDKLQTEIQITENESIDFPAHLHTDLELFLVRSGCIQVRVGDQSMDLKAGDFAVIFPNMIHSYMTKEPHSQFTMAICRTSLLGEYLSQLLHCRPENPFVSHKELHPDIEYAMHGMYLQEQEKPDSSVYRALVQLILARALPKVGLEPEREPKSIDLTSRLVRYLAQNFQQQLSLDILSKELGISKYHLSHVFSSRLHTSFSDYVNFLRLNHAKELLRTTDLSILEIGFACGFTSQRTFNRVFQEQFSMSPRQFRMRKDEF
ncbi:MAG: AraC family transcriptional regulator [Massiliimalia sp.]|jgi:AraC-like DNA-binding protein